MLTLTGPRQPLFSFSVTFIVPKLLQRAWHRKPSCLRVTGARQEGAICFWGGFPLYISCCLDLTSFLARGGKSETSQVVSAIRATYCFKLLQIVPSPTSCLRKGLISWLHFSPQWQPMVFSSRGIHRVGSACHSLGSLFFYNTSAQAFKPWLAPGSFDLYLLLFIIFAVWMYHYFRPDHSYTSSTVNL